MSLESNYFILFLTYILKTALKTNLRTISRPEQGHFCHCFTMLYYVYKYFFTSSCHSSVNFFTRNSSPISFANVLED